MRSLSRETRPKSMATVVVVLLGVCDRSSTPALASVMTASVVSGSISETEPTSVVLPTPNPPAMTIFADVAPRRALPGTELELAKSTEHPFQQVSTKLIVEAARLVDLEQAGFCHVADDHAGDAERYTQTRGDL